MKYKLTRRHLLQGAATVAGATTLGGTGLISGLAHGQTAQKSALLVIFMNGGYNALFSNADAFRGAGTFGVTATNAKVLPSGLVIDNATFGTNLPASAQANMAAIGINHGLSSHDPAKVAGMTDGSRSYALRLAAAMGGTAPLKCAVVGGSFPAGPRPAEGGVSMQSITDMQATINSLGAGGTLPVDVPERPKAALALTAARTMSQADFAANPESLISVKNAYDTQIAALGGAEQTFTFGAISAAYGMTGQTAVNNFTQQMVAAELMVRAGTNVVIAVSNAGWDTHGDTNGATVRTRMNASILPGLKVFSERMLADTTRNVTVAIIGDFARSLPGSDHARCIGATVWGTKVRQGASGKVNATVGMPAANAAGQAYSVAGFWSYLAAVAKVPTNPFGVNPHSGLVLP